MRRLIIVTALALVAVACGGDGASEEFVSPSTSQPSPTTTDTGPISTEAADGTTSTVPPTTPPAAPAELPESDYPDVVVADLAGGELNLRELALETKPVLLWFWAPH
jgi:hypothetical protein